MNGRICRNLPLIATFLSLSAAAQQWTAAQRGWLYILDVEDGNGHGRILLIDPTQSALKGTLVTDYHPDFGICPDGARLYVMGGPQSSGSLSVFDTQSGKLLNRVPLPDRAVYTVRPAQAGIVCSSDGRWLFIQIMKTLSPGMDQHFIAVLDSSTGRLSSQISLPACGIAQFIPWPFGAWDLAVECSFTNSLRFVSLDTAGDLLQTKDVALTWADPNKPDGSPAQKPERITTSIVVDSSHRSVAIFRAGGGLDQLDPDTLVVQTKIKDIWQRWFPRGGVLSAAGLFYLGFLPYEERTQTEGLLNGIAVFTTANWNEITTSSTALPFWSLAISQNGQVLYTANSKAQSITAIDTSTMQALKTIAVGGEPSLILVQP